MSVVSRPGQYDGPSLRECTSCGRKIPAHIDTCPHCGNIIRKRAEKET